MSELASMLRQVAEALLWPFDILPRKLGLLAFAVVTGLLMLLLVGKVTPQGRLKHAREQMSSAIYELRLYLDSPRRIFVAQGRLVLWSLNYLAYLLPAFALLLPILALLYAPLEVRYGLAPLATETDALVRIDLREPLPASAEQAKVDGGTTVKLAAPPVLLADERALYLRVEISERGLHRVRIEAPGWQVEKRISAEARTDGEVSAERRSGLAHLFALGNEPPLPSDGPVSAVVVSHESRNQSFVGLEMPWWVFWLVVATVVALAFKKRLGVTL
jgi:hypothetical protein